MTVDVRVLGPLEVVAARGRLHSSDFASKKARRLFEVLLLAGGQVVSKDALLEDLWRRQLPRNPHATVETAVSLARRALSTVSDERLILTETGGYRIDTDVVDLDLTRLDLAIEAAERAPRSERVELLAAALADVRGRLLSDEFATDWLLPRRERVDRRIEFARLMLAACALDDGAFDLAHDTAAALWTASDVVLEDAYAIGALARGAQGRRAEAESLLRMAQERLARHGGTPGPVLSGAADRLRRPWRAAAGTAALRVPDDLVAAAAGLPVVVPFLGRTVERARIESASVQVGATGSPGTESAWLRPSAVWLHVEGGRGIGVTRLLEMAIEWTAPALGVDAVHVLHCAAGDELHDMLLASRVARAVARRSGRPTRAERGGALFRELADDLAAAGATLLVVDGVDRADPASIALLRALVGDGGAPRLMVLSGGGPAPEGMASLCLGPLAPADLEPLGAGDWFDVSGGHPTVLRVAIEAGRLGGAVTLEGSRDLAALLEALDPVAGAVVRRTDYDSGVLTAADGEEILGVDRASVRAALQSVVDAGLATTIDHDRIRIASSLLTAFIRR